MPKGFGETHTSIRENCQIALYDCALTWIGEELVAQCCGLKCVDNVRIDTPSAQSFPDQVKRRRAIGLFGMKGIEIGFNLLPALVPGNIGRLVCLPHAGRTDLRSLLQAFDNQLWGGLV